MTSFEQQSFEKKHHADSFHKEDNKNKHLLSTQMQFALAKRYFGYVPDTATMLIWIDADNPKGHAKVFRDIVTADPSLIDRFANENEREKVLSKIEGQLYVSETKRASQHYE